MIFNSKYPELEKIGETIDLKSLGSSTFGLMKQNRKGNFMFDEKYPLLKFGQFAEVRDSSAKSSSEFIETEDDSDYTAEGDDDDDDDDDDDKGFDDDDTIFGSAMFGFDNGTIYDFEKINNDYCPNLEELHSFFDNVDEVAQPEIETGGVDEV
ncbi:unnamed protein product [Lactuca saligna]|uniref:Uncharacterized protein n=1 Tax=Lactuca saligna TaxID=75948 RepID=A0AA35V6C7_LACSI|nr:unnamed protein product [Lactuca saligna]